MVPAFDEEIQRWPKSSVSQSRCGARTWSWCS